MFFYSLRKGRKRIYTSEWINTKIQRDEHGYPLITMMFKHSPIKIHALVSIWPIRAIRTHWGLL